MALEHLLDQAQAAEALRVSPRTLEAWRSRGVGPAYLRVGRARRYRASDLERWADSRVVDTAQSGDPEAA